MDWDVYWFMLPVCIVVATTAMFSGISGAALLTPFFILGFPLLGVPTLSFIQAIGTSLFLETSGFGSGVVGYTRRGLVDYRFARRLLLVALPAGAIGAVLARHSPTSLLRAVYGLLMFTVSYLLWTHRPLSEEARAQARAARLGGAGEDPSERVIVSREGRRYAYVPRGQRLTLALTGAGGTLAGLISTGIGEVTLPNLVRRIGMPVPVAAATSVVVVAATVVGAATTHFVQLIHEGGFGAVPWNLIVWAVPGAVTGAQIGARLQGRVPERASSRFFGTLFLGIGTAFLLTAARQAGLV